MRITIDIDGVSEATATTTSSVIAPAPAQPAATWTGIDGGSAPIGANAVRSTTNNSASGDAYSGDAVNAGAAPHSP